uniref:Non-nucleocapsid protein n=1 Tax=Solenopsis invicta virus 14 TaxID=2810810 RepID=A0A891H5M7_9VIRU|nr:non-nucleocapsid protein [Solenopsis invicta virus 14]QRK69447.1 non-nucleocapsid protein [Solenopsis invicta virus 14]QRK69449.1 non-nucleocapsid protein [Solenopsis invicta virus 14]
MATYKDVIVEPPPGIQQGSIDFKRLYEMLPVTIQEWLPMVQLQDPTKVPDKDRLISLIEALYGLIRQAKGTIDPDYNTVYKYLPDYIEVSHNLLIGVDESPIGNIDYVAFFNMDLVQNEVGGWLSLIMLKKPDRMVHNQMEIMAKLATKICNVVSTTDVNHEKVVIHLPKWINHLCVEMTKAEHTLIQRSSPKLII